MYSFWKFICTFYTIVGPQQFKIFPRLIKVQEGNAALFKCIHEEQINWKFISNDNSSWTKINSDISNVSNIIDNDDPIMFINNVLLIKNVKLKHYGYYNCLSVDEANGVMFQDTAALKVIGINYKPIL